MPYEKSKHHLSGKVAGLLALSCAGFAIGAAIGAGLNVAMYVVAGAWLAHLSLAVALLGAMIGGFVGYHHWVHMIAYRTRRRQSRVGP